MNLWFVIGLLHTNPNKFENASFSLLWPSVITRNCEKHESGVFQQPKRFFLKILARCFSMDSESGTFRKRRCHSDNVRGFVCVFSVAGCIRAFLRKNAVFKLIRISVDLYIR